MIPNNAIITQNELKQAFKEQFDLFEYKFGSQHPLDRTLTQKVPIRTQSNIQGKAIKFSQTERSTMFQKLIHSQLDKSQSIGYLNPYHNKLLHVSKDAPDGIPTPRKTYLDDLKCSTDSYYTLPSLRASPSPKINCQERNTPDKCYLNKSSRYRYKVAYDPILSQSGKFNFTKSLSSSFFKSQ